MSPIALYIGFCVSFQFPVFISTDWIAVWYVSVFSFSAIGWIYSDQLMCQTLWFALILSKSVSSHAFSIMSIARSSYILSDVFYTMVTHNRASMVCLEFNIASFQDIVQMPRHKASSWRVFFLLQLISFFRVLDWRWRCHTVACVVSHQGGCIAHCTVIADSAGDWVLWLVIGSSFWI